MDRDTAVRRNVEILTCGAAAIGDYDLETLMPLVSDEFELHAAIAGAFVGASVYRGKEGARQYLEDIKEAFDDFRFEPLSFSAWRDYLVCPTRFSGHGTASGVDIDLEMTAVWRVREGLVIWGRTFFSREEALEAIGASENELEVIE